MAPGKKRGDVTWEHCMPLENDKKHLQCNYCEKTFWGGVFRMKHHLAGTRKNVAPCSQASEEATETFRKLLELNKSDKEDRDERRCDIGCSDSYYPERDPSADQGEKGKRKASVDGYVPVSEKKQCTLNESSENGKRDTVCGAIARFFLANRIPVNVVESSTFASMMESVSHFGKGLKLPSYDELENRCLDKELDNIEALMNIQKKEWEKRGCTLPDNSTSNTANTTLSIPRLPPAENTYKLNVDAGLLLDGGATIGGLLRSHSGSWIVGFYQLLPHIDGLYQSLSHMQLLEAELQVIYTGLLLLKQDGYSNVQIESDSLQAVHLLQGQVGISHPYYSLVQRSQKLLNSISNCTVLHTRRSANRAAHTLASYAKSSDVFLHVLHVLYNPPPTMYDVLRSDASSV